MLPSMCGLLEMMGQFLGTYVGANARAWLLKILMGAIHLLDPYWFLSWICYVQCEKAHYFDPTEGCYD